MSFPLIKLDDPTKTHALDTSVKDLGAPGRPGELRFHLHETYGYQIYRLVLNQSGAQIAAYRGVDLKTADAAGSFATVDALSGTATSRRFGGIAQNAIADDHWGWVLCGGEGVATCLTLCAKDAVIETAASGKFDDTSGSGHPVGVMIDTTVGGGDEDQRVLITGQI